MRRRPCIGRRPAACPRDTSGIYRLFKYGSRGQAAERRVMRSNPRDDGLMQARIYPSLTL
jgi:hypothetical protein